MSPIRILAAVGALLLVQACGGSSPSTPTPTPTPQPTPPQPIVVAQINRALSANYFYPNTVTTSRSGTLTVQLDWTYAANTMLLGLATSSCTIPAYQSFSCSFLVQDSLAKTTPTKTIAVPNLEAGSYVIVVSNWGPGDESFNYVATLTPGQ